MMDGISGKKTKVVISCTTKETVRVSQPIVFYEANVAHIIHLNESPRKSSQFYASLIDEIKRQVSEKREVRFIEHNEAVYRYNVMLKLVNDIIKDTREEYGIYADIYVNISSGTSEYAAAAMCACMMNPGVMPFTVRVREHSIPFERYLEESSIDGRPVGDALSVYDPRMIETFCIEPPDEDLLRYLSFFAEIQDTPCTTATIISMLESKGVWSYTATKKSNPGKNAAAMQYRRTVLEPLLNKGWIANGPSKNRWVVTSAGRSILDVFCDKEDARSISEKREDFIICREKLSNSFEQKP